MRTSCAMMALSVNPPTEEKGAEEDRVEEAGGVVILVCVRVGRS